MIDDRKTRDTLHFFVSVHVKRFSVSRLRDVFKDVKWFIANMWILATSGGVSSERLCYQLGFQI